MNTDQLYQLLLRSLDESLSEQEQAQLDAGLAQSAELRAEKEQLLALRATLEGQADAYQFKPFFAGRVMEKIRLEKNPPVQAANVDFINALVLSFQRLAVPSFALICIMLAYTYFTADSLTLQAVMGISDVAPEDLTLLNI